MDYELQLSKAVSLQTAWAPRVKLLMAPALNAANVDYFWFVRLLEGHFHFSVGIQPPLVELYRKRKTPELFFNNLIILTQRQTTVFWDLHQSETLTNDMKHQLGLKQGICIFRRIKNAMDIFYIANTKADQMSIYDLYLKNPNAIFRLTLFFQEKVLPHLPLQNKDFLLPYMDGYSMKFPSEISHGSGEGKGNFIDATTLKRFTLHQDNKAITLSCRELECLYHLAKGYTSKETAQALGLSFRTVEHYLLNVRNKTDCSDKTALIKLFRKNDCMMWFDD